MQAADDLKVAHVQQRGKHKMFVFSKGQTNMLPPSMFLGKTECRMFQNATAVKFCREKLTTEGIEAKTFQPYDRIEILGVTDFYERLLSNAACTPGMFVLLDEDLKSAIDLRLHGLANDDKAA